MVLHSSAFTDNTNIHFPFCFHILSRPLESLFTDLQSLHNLGRNEGPAGGGARSPTIKGILPFISGGCPWPFGVINLLPVSPQPHFRRLSVLCYVYFTLSAGRWILSFCRTVSGYETASESIRVIRERN